jgi:hypothetical protein
MTTVDPIVWTNISPLYNPSSPSSSSAKNNRLLSDVFRSIF